MAKDKTQDDDRPADKKEPLRFVKPVNKSELVATVTTRLRDDLKAGGGLDVVMGVLTKYLTTIVEATVSAVGAEFAPEGETPKAQAPAGAKPGDPAYDRAHAPEHAPAPPALHDDPHTDPGEGQDSAVHGKGKARGKAADDADRLGKAHAAHQDDAKAHHDAVKAEAEGQAAKDKGKATGTGSDPYGLVKKS